MTIQFYIATKKIADQDDFAYAASELLWMFILPSA
jgi:hypothetical protein